MQQKKMIILIGIAAVLALLCLWYTMRAPQCSTVCRINKDGTQTCEKVCHSIPDPIEPQA